MSAAPCLCGHKAAMHDDRFGCISDRCMNACHAYRPDRRPAKGERPVFGVHRLPAEEAWTPEPLSTYWGQSERWRP